MGSSRFPGKPLASVAGVPLVVRVCERASQVFDKSKVFVATESTLIGQVVEEHGYQVIYTSDKCVTGTDRIAQAARILGSSQVINLQGDEPLVRAEDLRKVLDAASVNPDVTHNCFTKVESINEMRSKNVPKVVVSNSGKLLYASRAPIPRGKGQELHWRGWKQVCIYYFPASHLELFGEDKAKAELEKIEDIEILRLLEFGLEVTMHKLEGKFQAVDEVSDVAIVEKLLLDGH